MRGVSPRNCKLRLDDIREATAHMPDDFKERHCEIPWYQMQGMRNLLTHEYFGVDTDVLWKTVREDLPALKCKIQKIL